MKELFTLKVRQIMVTNEMKELLKKIADLAYQASEEVYDDDNEEHFSKRQLIGRIYRLSGFHQKLPLYIRNNKNAYK